MDAFQELQALMNEIEHLKLERRKLRDSLYQRQKRLQGKTITVDGESFDAYELSTFGTGSWRMQSPRTNFKRSTDDLANTISQMRTTRDILKGQVQQLKNLKTRTTMTALRKRAAGLVKSRKAAVGTDVTKGPRTGPAAHDRFGAAIDKTDEATANWLRSISSDAVFDMLDNLDPDDSWYTREDFDEAAKRFYESQDYGDLYTPPSTKNAR